MESIVGKILCDRYRIIQKLNQDDFSTIYLAEDLAHDSNLQCRVERLEPDNQSSVLSSQAWQKIRQSFMAQGTILQNVSQHPQIPRLLAFFECDRLFYLVHELIQGQTLEQQLQQGLIDEAEAIDWLQEILSILEFVHKLDLAHLNIQPSSLIQHQDGRKLLADFAAIKNAVLFGDRSTETKINHQFASNKQDESLDRGKMVSRPQAASDRRSGFRADIHALGKTIIYALTGKVADSIQAESTNVVVSAKTANSERLATANIKPQLAGLLNKMLGNYPNRAYQSASEVLVDLDFDQNVVTFPPPFSKSNSPAVKPGFKSKNRDYASAKFSRSKLIKGIIWSLLTLPFVVASIIVFIGLNRNSYRSFTEYDNNEYQFSIKYPQNWSQRQIDDPITGEVAVFTSPPESSVDSFREKVYIAVAYLPSESTNLEQYSQAVFQRIKETKGVDTEVHEDFQTTIDNLPARTVIYSRKDGKLKLRQMESFTIRNDRVYIAIYTAERAKFSKFYDTVEKMIDSWEIERS